MIHSSNSIVLIEWVIPVPHDGVVHVVVVVVVVVPIFGHGIHQQNQIVFVMVHPLLPFPFHYDTSIMVDHHHCYLLRPIFQNFENHHPVGVVISIVIIGI